MITARTRTGPSSSGEIRAEAAGSPWGGAFQKASFHSFVIEYSVSRLTTTATAVIDQASAARVANRTLIPIVNVDIHREMDVNVVKRFADVIIENREREAHGRLIREVRVSNRVDDIHTDWERY